MENLRYILCFSPRPVHFAEIRGVSWRKRYDVANVDQGFVIFEQVMIPKFVVIEKTDPVVLMKVEKTISSRTLTRTSFRCFVA